MDEIKKIYEQLPTRLLPWYRKNARKLPWRENKDPYRVWISEIMLQQTRVEAVKEYYTRFLKALPAIEDLANLSMEGLYKLWEGLGYYKRAVNLKSAAELIVEKWGGEFPTDYQEILSLPGVGAYTAGAIASICFDIPIPAVDGNVLRVLARVSENTQNIALPAVKKETETRLLEVYPKKAPGEFTQSLMELGALICLPNGKPKCEDCPLQAICLAYQHGTVNTLPVKEKPKKRKVEKKTVFVLVADGEIAFKQRSKEGLLAGLYEFPNTEGMLEGKAAMQHLNEIDVLPIKILKKSIEDHVFTHIKWEMVCYYVQCEKKAGDLLWKPYQALKKEVALPTAFRKFMTQKTVDEILRTV